MKIVQTRENGGT